MALDKHREQLKQELDSLEVTEEHVRNWHSHPVTKALFKEMEIEFIDSMNDLNQSKEVSVAWGLASDFVQEYKTEELTNEA